MTPSASGPSLHADTERKDVKVRPQSAAISTIATLDLLTLTESGPAGPGFVFSAFYCAVTSQMESTRAGVLHLTADDVKVLRILCKVPNHFFNMTQNPRKQAEY